MNKDYSTIFGNILIQYLKDAKAEIEKDGMIATMDEAILRAEEHFNGKEI